jgi:hypothetical protein
VKSIATGRPATYAWRGLTRALATTKTPAGAGAAGGAVAPGASAASDARTAAGVTGASMTAAL